MKSNLLVLSNHYVNSRGQTIVTEKIIKSVTTVSMQMSLNTTNERESIYKDSQPSRKLRQQAFKDVLLIRLLKKRYKESMDSCRRDVRYIQAVWTNFRLLIFSKFENSLKQ